jgi:hypothetical protein
VNAGAAHHPSPLGPGGAPGRRHRSLVGLFRDRLPGKPGSGLLTLGLLSFGLQGLALPRLLRAPVRLLIVCALLGAPAHGALGGGQDEPLATLLLRAAPAHAQEGPAVGQRAGGGVPGLGDLARALSDLLGSVRTITETTDGISDSARTVVEFVTRVSTTNWWEVAWELFTLITTRLLQAVVRLLHQAVALLLDSSFNFITQTPPAVSFRSPHVHDLWQRVRLLTNAGVAVVALGGGFNVILNRRLGTPYHGASEFFPRLLVGAALANTSLVWTGLAIELNNALCASIGESPLPGWERAAGALSGDLLGQRREATMHLLLAGVYLLVALLLLIQMLLRLALVDVLIVVAPLASLLLVLPQTEGWWRRWATSFTSTVFSQFVQVVALKLGGNLLVDIAAVSPGAQLVGPFLGLAMLVLTFKIPALLHAHVGDGLGAARQLAVNTVGRILARRLR